MTNPGDKAALLEMGEYWTRLAEQAEKEEAENSPKERGRN
jgi:hypothetical protein